jgi:DNA repair exonuclease SbcCD ATPase subunit
MKQKEIDNIHDKIRNPLTIIALELEMPDTNKNCIKKQIERINEFLKSLESDKEDSAYYSLLRIDKNNSTTKIFTTSNRNMFKNCKAFCNSLENLYVESSNSDEIISLTEFLNTISNI